MDGKLRAGIVGVSGYGGGEVARLLSQHPGVALTYVTSHTYAGQPLAKALPGVAGRITLTCEEYDVDQAIARCDVLFLAGEAGLAMKSAPSLLAAGKKVIDLSADFRLRSPSEYKQWYKADHTATDLLDTAVYGLPELFREHLTRDTQLVANPGCYVTSALLALAPLVKNHWIEPNSVIIDGLSGVSGAGRSKFGLDYHFSEVNESVRPYGVGGIHRHTPEIEQGLAGLAGESIPVTFTPHLVPITRGILTTAYALLKEDVGSLGAAYREFYRDEPFVVVLDDGEFPATKHVAGTNYCYLGVTVDRRTGRAIVVSAIDNLIKGTAGQAIQNMNVICGFEETLGLTMPAMWP